MSVLPCCSAAATGKHRRSSYIPECPTLVESCGSNITDILCWSEHGLETVIGRSERVVVDGDGAVNLHTHTHIHTSINTHIHEYTHKHT
jgi:hypothetical protein